MVIGDAVGREISLFRETESFEDWFQRLIVCGPFIWGCWRYCLSNRV